MKGRPDIYKDAKGFDVNPQNINSTGLNRKSYATHIKELKAKGYSAPTKTEFYEIVGLLFSMTEDDMREFMEDKSRPMWIQNIVRDLGNKMVRTRMMSDYRDWIFGKAKESFSFEGQVSATLNVTVDTSETAETLKKLRDGS